MFNINSESVNLATQTWGTDFEIEFALAAISVYAHLTEAVHSLRNTPRDLRVERFHAYLEPCSIPVKLNSATKHYDSLGSRGIAMRMHGSEQATEIKFLAGPAEV